MKRDELAKHFVELNFVPQDAVRWLSPSELRTFLSSTVSEIFGNYADKRELQKVFDSSLVEIPTDLFQSGEDFWFDYTADVGDGFDATFTVAELLARDSLKIEGMDHELPRGRMLVLGGDEVYPTASSKAYDDRMVGPYRAALPAADPQPLLLALPGNHDWYDGLTAFLRLFTQERSIGGWRTEQTRSYFTVRLPYGWWLVALDSQLDSYFDDPQLRYFEETLSANLSPGDSVIVCCATPAWLKAASGHPDAFNGLEWFERNFVTTRRVAGSKKREPTGAQARLWLSGDKHHYVRYAEHLDEAAVPGSARQLVTCGLGGAYLDTTQGLEPTVELLPPASRSWRDGDPATHFHREGNTFPSVKDSKAAIGRLGAPWRKEWIARRNPGVLSFMGVGQMFIFLVLLLFFWQGVRANENGRILDAYLDATARELIGFAGGALGLVALVVLVSQAPRLRGRPPLVSNSMSVLLVSQIGVALINFVGFGLLSLGTLDSLAAWAQFFTVMLAVTVIGALLSAAALGVWIVFFKGTGLESWAMMGQAIEEGKGFLRIRLTPDGTLTLYPIVSDEIYRDYEITTELALTSTSRPTRVPSPTEPPLTPRLIEAPYTVLRTPPTGGE